MESFDRSELRHTEVVERNSLPDADTLRQERGKADLLSGGDFYDFFLKFVFFLQFSYSKNKKKMRHVNETA